MNKFNSIIQSLLVAFLLAFISSSCASFTLRTSNSVVTGVDGQMIHRQNKQVFFWGIFTSRAETHVDKCISEHVAEVSVSRNFGQGLLHTVSLGCCNLMTIEYKCSDQ